MRSEIWIVPTLIVAGCASAQQRWLGPDERLVATGRVARVSVAGGGSGPTTIALAPDGAVWFTQSITNRIGRMIPDGSAPRRVRRSDRGELAAHHRARRRRQLLVLRASRGSDGADHAGRRDHGVSDSDARQPAACDRARRRRQHLVRHVRGRQDRPHHACRRHHRVRACRRRSAARARSRPAPTATSGSRSFTRARSAASRWPASSRSFRCRARIRAPATSRPAPTATCGSSS